MSDDLAVSELPLRSLGRGKVRDLYEVDAERLLLIATDRVSAFDVVMAETVPFKGEVLTQVSAWWLKQLESVVPHHLLCSDADEIIAEVPVLAPHREGIRGRAMLCRRAVIFPVECVIRGYISGSAWKEYADRGTVAGEVWALGLRESDRLPAPVFTPATKAATGHDENITRDRMAEIVGADVAESLAEMTRHIYLRASAVAEARGLIIADTKFEFGRVGDGAILLVDEVLTPDSSRFWAREWYAPGRTQPSFDKQPLRDWLDAERQAGRWNGEAPPPRLPEEIVAAASERYLELYRRLTGTELDRETT